MKSIRTRDKLYKKFSTSSPHSIFHEIYKIKLRRYNNILRSVITSAKSLYYHDKFIQNKNDIRKTWEIIRSAINNPPSNIFPSYVQTDSDHHITNKKEMADYFNSFFTNIGKKLALEIDSKYNYDFKKYLSTSAPNSKFNFSQTTENEINKVISELKSKHSTGIDNITSIFVKTYRHVLIKLLSLIVNQSLQTGIFPDNLKIAKVLPIYKGKDLDKNLVNNYRPISILPVLSKIFEKIVYNQLLSYFTKNNLFYFSQYGFRPNHSTEFAVLELTDLLYKKLDNNQNPVAIFMDLSKAFDTINHSILLHKLQYYGLSNTELHWFQSYLNDRKQFVMLENASSSLLNISTGVPQGSILGPLLFLIYVNDLHLSCDAKTIMYADDTCLLLPFYMNSNSNNNIQTQYINNKLFSVFQWLCANKLSLNTEKTKYMLFHFKQKQINENNLPNIEINSVQIKHVETIKFLGIHLDESLTWNNHVSEISNKISKVVGVLSILKHRFPTHILLTIYKSLILSHLNFGITLWGFNCCLRLKILQKKR